MRLLHYWTLLPLTSYLRQPAFTSMQTMLPWFRVLRLSLLVGSWTGLAKKLGGPASASSSGAIDNEEDHHDPPRHPENPPPKKNEYRTDVAEDLGMTPMKPSFLFMLIDDIGWIDFSYQGGIAHTPNIDAWTKRRGSVVFQDMHSGGTVCSPTRATVLTGRNHFRDCVDYVYACDDMRTCTPTFEFAPSKTFTVGDAIRAAAHQDSDYENGAYFAGKWHLGSFYNDSEAYGGRTSSPITHGFNKFNATVECAPTATLNCMCQAEWKKDCDFGHYDKPLCRGFKDCCFNYWWDDPLAPHGVTNLTWPTPPDDSLYLADAFSRFLHERKLDNHKPFMAQISFHNCHIPFIGSKESKEACAKGETCRLPEPGDNPYADEELDYYACMTELDNSVGLVLKALEKEGYYDNTMVWMTSDNGPEENCKPEGICEKADTRPYRPVAGPGSAGILRGRKRDIYEGGHRVAGIISFPSVVKEKDDSKEKEDDDVITDAVECWETVVTMDFLPTVMEILNVNRPPNQQDWAMDGRSILPLLKNPETFRWKYTEEGPRQIGIGYYHAEIPKMIGWYVNKTPSIFALAFVI